MIRFATDPPDADRFDPIKAHEEAEAKRLEAWEDFVAAMRSGRPSVQLRLVAELLDGQSDPFYRTVAKDTIRVFAEAHGWPDTLRAIAQAMAAEDQARRELMDRR